MQINPAPCPSQTLLAADAKATEARCLVLLSYVDRGESVARTLVLVEPTHSVAETRFEFAEHARDLLWLAARMELHGIDTEQGCHPIFDSGVDDVHVYLLPDLVGY